MRRLMRGDVEAANAFVKPERTTSAVRYKARDHSMPGISAGHHSTKIIYP